MSIHQARSKKNKSKSKTRRHFETLLINMQSEDQRFQSQSHFSSLEVSLALPPKFPHWPSQASKNITKCEIKSPLGFSTTASREADKTLQNLTWSVYCEQVYSRSDNP
ncbi:hypothetical protein RRG08_013608 [Elysia crispata]|uniref:Uncharacterized protein n=1 Tax=Elysia crispata TaxID=231223 RepID=A0AAE1ANB2_9GAST|nr:hypothetical protein RRG08_013608 [Elysia crispata]